VVSRVTPLSFGWIAPLGLLGLWFSFRHAREYVWLYVLLLNNLVLLLAFYVVVRFRLPIEAVLVILTGPALQRVALWFSGRAVRPLAWSATALVLLGLACNSSFPAAAERARGREMELLLEDAQRRYRKGDAEGAARQLETLIRRDGEDLPRLLQAHQLLAQIYSRPGVSFADSVMKSPAHFETAALIGRLEDKRRERAITFQERRYLGHLYMQAERLHEARDVLSEALAVRPPEPLTRYELARVERALGDAGSARDNLRAAMDDGLLFTSKGLRGAFLLAQIYREQGDGERAAEWTAQAARQTAMLPWNATGGVSEPWIAELKSLPGYTDPVPLESLIPLNLR
jgi:Tfp pilus assembly protein PilF